MSELIELLLVFLKLGAFTVGGGIAMIPVLQNEMVEKKKWFDKEEFVDLVAICQSMPGIVAINMATYVGYKKKGTLGSAVATFGVVTPSFVFIMLIANIISSIGGGNPYINGAMAGLRAAALGLVIVALIQLAPNVIKSKRSAAAACVSFLLIAVLNINTAYVILLFLVLGVVLKAGGDGE